MALIDVVEDDESIRELVLYALDSSGFEARGFERSREFWQSLSQTAPDLVILDIMLPGEDGLSILSKLRRDARRRDTPVILLAAKSAEYDKVKGLDLGADDYVTKPFGVMELISRVRALLRRAGRQSSGRALALGPVTLDEERHIVTSGGEEVSLTHKEFELLAFLLKNAGIVLTRDRLMSSVWGFDFEGESRTIDMHIRTLRQKLGKGGAIIRTVRGVGYKAGDQ